jgi:hypothetical protein
MCWGLRSILWRWNLAYKMISLISHMIRFNIVKNHQQFLNRNDYHQVNYHWCSCPYLLWFVLLVHKCTFKVSQVMVLCKWHESLHGGTKCKYVVERPVVPSIWPMQEGTNLSQDEVKFPKQVGFVFNKWQLIFPQNIFSEKSSIPINQPTNVML